MNILWRLIRTQFLDGFRAQWVPESTGDGRKVGGRVVLLAFSMLYLLGMYTFMAYSLYQAGVAFESPELGLRFSFLAAGLMTFLMGLFYVTGRLFNCKDSLLLASLPVPGETVFLSKLAQVYLEELGLTACLVLPSVVFYGVGQGTAPLFWPGAMVMVLLAPVLPLTLACVLCMALTYITGFLKKKELFQILFSLLLVGGMLVFQFKVMQSGEEGDLMTQAAALIQAKSAMLYKIWPPAGWMTTALTGAAKDAALAWGMTVLSAAVALCLTAMLSRKIYIRGMLSATETGGKAKTAKIRGQGTSPFLAVYCKEWRLLLRSPTYAMNGLSGAILVPVCMTLPLAAAGGGSLLEKISAGGLTPEALTVPLAGVMLISCWVNAVATTAVSREGKMRLLLKSLPLDTRTLLRGKLWMSLTLCWMGALLVGILGMAVVKIPLAVVLPALGMAFCAAWPADMLGLLVDMYRPRFRWNSETEAIKQNTNALIGMGLVPVLFLPQIIAEVLLFSQSLWLQCGAFLLLSVTEGGILTVWMNRAAEKAADRW